MEFLNADIAAYAELHTSPETPVLSKINRETHLKVLNPRMLSGHLQGRVLSLLSKLQQPKCVLEIGTYTAYATLCLAEGLADGGKVITIESNEELEHMIRRFVTEAGMEDRVDLKMGDARSIIPKLDETFDMVFIDADKEFYGEFYDLVFEKVRPGGLIIADNVLWSGKVIKKTSNTDKSTSAVISFNNKINEDRRVENVLLPVRDGLMIIRKL